MLYGNDRQRNTDEHYEKDITLGQRVTKPRLLVGDVITIKKEERSWCNCFLVEVVAQAVKIKLGKNVSNDTI